MFVSYPRVRQSEQQQQGADLTIPQMPFGVTHLNSFTRADAGLVVAQLSYRAFVTRTAAPFLHRLTKLYGPFGGGNPRQVMRWTDERIAYAISHDTLPDISNPFTGRVQHREADSYLTIAQLAFRGGLTPEEPDVEAIRRRHGSFHARGVAFTISWIDQRMGEAGARLRAGAWSC